MHRMKLLRAVLVFFVFYIASYSSYLRADNDETNAIIVLEDMEISNFLTKLIKKIYKIAEISRPIKVFLLQNDEINAFATYGGNVCVNTGLLKAFDTAVEIFGVLAHEIGHVHGKHIELLTAYAEKQNKIALMTLPLFPIALPLLIEEQLKYSRDKENAADNFAIDIFRKSGYPLKHLKRTFIILQGHKRIQVTADLNRNFLSKLTHPLDEERLMNIDRYLQEENPKNTIPFDKKLERRFGFIKYKIQAYTGNPDEFLSNYSENITDEIAYGRAIAFGRIFNVEASSEIFDMLIAKHEGNNKYFLDAKAQMLFENGRIEEALLCYKALLTILRNNDDIMATKLLIARAKMSLKNWDPKEIIDMLNSSLVSDVRVKEKWQFHDGVTEIFIACFGKMKNEIMRKVYALQKTLLDMIRKNDLEKTSLEHIKKDLEACSKKIPAKSHDHDTNIAMIRDCVNYINYIIEKVL